LTSYRTTALPEQHTVRRPRLETGLPRVAIAGRPNVGKSTLYNRFAGGRRAITDPTPGVTRDPVGGVWEHNGKKAFLFDTGGIKSGAEGMDALVAHKSREAIDRAACIILVLDVREYTAEDEELVESLRPRADKVIVAVNKVDTEKHEDAVGEFWALGFPRLFAVSAAHGRNCDELADAVFGSLDFSKGAEPEAEAREAEITLAILGKPNTGKSTLINKLLGEDLAIVSDIPGTTRDIVEGHLEFKGRNYRILDTAGIRKKSRVQENVEYYSVTRAIASIEEADVVLLLIDAREGLADQDKKIADQIVKKGRGVILVLNKWDLMPQSKKTLEEAAEKIRFQFPVLDFAPVQAVSARTGRNVETLLEKAALISEQLDRRIETGALNRALEEWVKAVPPPRDGRRAFKMRYITQVRTRPLRFVLFVNRTEDFPPAYAGYIKNKIRQLGFGDVPLELELRLRASAGRPRK